MSETVLEDQATRSEVCAAAIADAFAEDGEIFASPMGLLPMLGVFGALAVATVVAYVLLNNEHLHKH